MSVPLLDLPTHRWECLSCDRQSITREHLPAARLHQCAGLAGMSLPMVPAGTRGENRVNEREDYIGRELVQLNADGRPVMNVMTVREDGEDCTVYAPTATARGEA